MTRPVPELDTAIVGGGITGLYTAHCLRRRLGSRHRIGIFEASDRLGGRIETVEMDGFLAEFGPMRFEKGAQPLFMGLVNELSLATKHFPPYMAATDPETLFDLDREEGRGDSGRLLTSLQLLKLGVLRILGHSPGDMNDPEDPRHAQWWAGLDEAYYGRLRHEFMFQDEPLRDWGFWNALHSVLGQAAVENIMHWGTFYHVIHHNPSAAEWIIFWLRGLHPRDELVGIEQGVEEVVRQLVRRLDDAPQGRIRPRIEHRLTALHPVDGELVELEFRTRRGVRTVRARHVVLALPWSPLQQLRNWLPKEIVLLTESVIPIPLLKCFFVTRNPWWDGSTPPQTRASSIPAREVHYACRGEGDRQRGMVMIYGDRPSMDFWKVFARGDDHWRAELNGDSRLVDNYLTFLGRDPGEVGPKQSAAERAAITTYGIHDWSREPFEGGCHVWKAGVDVEQALDALAAFPLPGGTRANVHICGEAYSDFQGFIEGGLRTALSAVEWIK